MRQAKVDGRTSSELWIVNLLAVGLFPIIWSHGNVVLGWHHVSTNRSHGYNLFDNYFKLSASIWCCDWDWHLFVWSIFPRCRHLRYRDDRLIFQMYSGCSVGLVGRARFEFVSARFVLFARTCVRQWSCGSSRHGATYDKSLVDFKRCHSEWRVINFNLW